LPTPANPTTKRTKRNQPTNKQTNNTKQEDITKTMANKEIQFVSRPDPDVSLNNFGLKEIPVPDAASLNSGDLLVKLIYVSVDPYMRGRMNEGKGYAAGWELNAPPTGGLVAEILETKNEKFSKGDYVVGYLPWKLQQIVPEAATKALNKIPDQLKAHASYFIGACGMPGLSALLPIEKIGEPKEGEVAFISGAAGAVGSAAGQILKLKGVKVFGSAG
jgi:NADPH-dependent curcumin reductase CurA